MTNLALTQQEWFARAHYIYTHLPWMIVVWGFARYFSNPTVEIKLPREVREWFRRRRDSR